MIVYRIENEHGFGPYGSGNLEGVQYNVCRLLNREHSCSDNHPNIFRDGLSSDENLVCGFATLRALHTWFDGLLDDVLRAGFRITVYQVYTKSVQFGRSGRQLMFRKKKLLRTLPI